MMEAPGWFVRDVSRETLEKLDAYKALLEKWTRKINLISKSTIDDIAMRHIWDSAQIYQQVTHKWVDLGSGGGLPGVVIAVLAAGWNEPMDMVLVESDQRKTTFLRTCARELDISLNVIPKRIDEIESQQGEIVSARALSDLSGLLEIAVPHLSQGGTCVFMKGARWQAEVENARKSWQFSCEAAPSKTNSDAAILRIRDIERA